MDNKTILMRNHIKANERFQYYFSPKALEETNSMPNPSSNEKLQESNNIVAGEQQGEQLSATQIVISELPWYHGINLPPYRIEHPTYGKNLVPQFELLKEFQKRYNSSIDRKRTRLLHRRQYLEAKANPSKFNIAEIERINNLLPTDPYQKIRAAHFNLMKELISLSRETLRDMNRFLIAEGLNAVDAEKPFSVETSYPAMMNRLGVAAPSTIYRHLRRLHVAGFLAPDSDLKEARNGKVFHGTNAPIEVRLNPLLMLIFDKKNPDFEPETVLPNPTENQAFPWRLRANCNHIDSLKSIGNSSIEVVRNSSQAQNEPLTSPTAKNGTPLKRTPQNQAKSQFDGPASDPIIREEIRRMVQLKRKSWSAADFGNDLQKLVFAQVFLFVNAAKSTLWKNREIHTGTLRKLENYLIDNYFKGISSESELISRISDMHKIIQRNAKYVEGDPANRFVLLPLQYFDLKRKALGPDDYSGFVGQLRLNRKAEEWSKINQQKAASKKEAFERKNQLIKLKRYLRNFDTEHWTKSKFDRCHKWVESNTPEWNNAFLQLVSYRQPLPNTNSVK